MDLDLNYIYISNFVVNGNWNLHDLHHAFGEQLHTPFISHCSIDLEGKNLWVWFLTLKVTVSLQKFIHILIAFLIKAIVGQDGISFGTLMLLLKLSISFGLCFMAR